MALSPGNTAVVATPADAAATSYVDWPAIIAGAVAATAISVVMLTFGSAIGLGFASPYAGEGWGATAFAIAAALWFVWVQLSGYLAGGYLTGRLRRRVHDATQHEVEVRDAAHGVLVWGVGVILSAMIASASVSGAVGAVGSATGGVVASSADVADQALSYAAERALRTADAGAIDEDAAQEAATILGSAIADGDLDAADRTYLTQRVAQAAGVAPEVAQQRIAELETFVSQTVDEAQAAADAARVMGVLSAFLIAATLVAGAAAALFAAQLGGSHRDQGVVYAFLSRH